MNKYCPQNIRVLMVGADLSSRGGIASVIQALYFQNQSEGCPVSLALLKTSYYNERPKYAEPFLFALKLVSFPFIVFFKKISIVHIHSSAFYSFYRKAIFCIFAKLMSKKVIFHLHASDFYDFFFKTRNLTKLLCHFVFRLSDIVIVLCADWERALITCYPGITVKTVHNPVTVADYILSDSDCSDVGLRVLFLGFFSASKGMKDIVSVAKQLKHDNVTSISITVAGKGELEQYLCREVDASDLGDILKIRHWVQGKEKKELLASADVFFLPSYKEGMPISILEAMSSGLSIVSTRIAGIPDLVEDGRNGYLLDPGDVNGFVKILKDLSRNKEELMTMKAQSFEMVNKFDTKIIFDEIKGIYFTI